MFEGIGEAKVFERGAYFEEGVYPVVKLLRVLTKDTRKSGPVFIVETEVVESLNPDVTPGMRRTWMQKLQDKDIGLSAVKEFFANLNGINLTNKEQAKKFNSELQEYVEAVTTFDGPVEDHPLHGRLVKLEVTQVETQKGGEFSRHNWTHIPE